MYALTAAILATMAVVFASAAPAPQRAAALGDPTPLEKDFWINCGTLLSTDNIFSTTTQLDTKTLTDKNGLWYLAAYPKGWMNNMTQVTDSTTLTCTNWTVSYDGGKNLANMTLQTNPPSKTVTWMLSPVNSTVAPLIQTLQVQSPQATPPSITGLSFVQLDGSNAALIGCTWTAAAGAVPGYHTAFWNVLTRDQGANADATTWAKVQTLNDKVPNLLDVTEGNKVNHDNKQCMAGPAPSSATQVTAMSGLVLAIVAMFTSQFA